MKLLCKDLWHISLFFFVFTFSHVRSKAQDSIYFFDGTIKVGKIREISPMVVKYTWPTSDFPIFIADKQDVHYIKYPNGITDTLNKYPPKALIKNTENTRNVTFNKDDKLVILDNRAIEYEGKRYGNMAIKKIIERNPYKANNPDLMVEYQKMRKYRGRKKKDILFGIIGFAAPIVVGAYVGLLELVLTSSQAASRDLAIGAAVGVIAGSVFIPLGILDNKKLIKQRNKLVELYNNTP